MCQCAMTKNSKEPLKTPTRVPVLSAETAH